MSNTNYTKFSKIEDPEEIQEVEEAFQPEPEPVHGIVVDCLRLNVRVAPYLDADIITIINASTDLVIDEAESTEDFYKICTATGIEGFCVREFIKVIS